MQKKYIPRKLEQELEAFLDKQEVIAIVGPRQVGKTTLCKRLQEELSENKQVKFASFEDRDQRNLFKDKKDFKEKYEQFDVVIIDEFQRAEKGGEKLKYLYDSTDIKFIITGSSSLDLMFSTGKYMVGRMNVFNLYPFSFREFLFAKDQELFEGVESRIDSPLVNFNPDQSYGEQMTEELQSYFEEYLIYGGYPEVVKADENKRKILKDLFDLYLTKDVNELLKLAADDKLAKLTEALSAQIGGLINYNNLGELSGLKYKKLKEYMNILEETYIIDTIRPFYTNRQKELVKNPIPYFIDTGLRNYLINDFKKLDLRQDKGALVENFVFMRLSKEFSVGFENIKYWRTKSGAEVDFVVKKEGEQIPVEVKYRNDPTPGKSFYSFLRKYEPSRGYVLTKSKSKIVEKEGTKVYFIPVFYL